MNINKVISASPYLEVAIRQAYWRSPALSERRNRKPTSKSELSKTNSLSDVIAGLRDWGVGAGDLLVVHSGYEGLKPPAPPHSRSSMACSRSSARPARWRCRRSPTSANSLVVRPT